MRGQGTWGDLLPGACRGHPGSACGIGAMNYVYRAPPAAASLLQTVWKDPFFLCERRVTYFVGEFEGPLKNLPGKELHHSSSASPTCFPAGSHPHFIILMKCHPLTQNCLLLFLSGGLPNFMKQPAGMKRTGNSECPGPQHLHPRGSGSRQGLHGIRS